MSRESAASCLARGATAPDDGNRDAIEGVVEVVCTPRTSRKWFAASSTDSALSVHSGSAEVSVAVTYIVIPPEILIRDDSSGR